MTLSADPLILLTALAFLVPWGELYKAAKRGAYKLASEVLRRRLARQHHQEHLFVYTGHLNRGRSFKLAQQIRQARKGDAITILLDTYGGETSAGLQVMHALAAHDGYVTVRIADECWSSGTLIACAADTIIMGPDANIGHADTHIDVDQGRLWCGPTMTAAARGESVDLVRAKHALRDVVDLVVAARQQRGTESPGKSRGLAEQLILADADHSHPILFEEAEEMGLRVRVDPNPAWATLMRLTSWSRAD